MGRCSKVILAAIGGVLVLMTAGSSAAQPTGDVPLIPRSLLFGNPDKAAPEISPDGKRLAYLAPVEGVMNVWVGPADKPEDARPVTEDRKRGIRHYAWAYTNRHILYIQDKDGDENWHIYAVDLEAGSTKDLTPIEDVHAQFQSICYKFPTEILVSLNDRDAQLHDVHRLNIETGERTLVVQNDEGFLGYLTDDDYRVRFAIRMLPDGSSDLFKRTEDDEWELYTNIPEEDSLTTNPVGFDKTGEHVYMLDSRGRDTAALTCVDVETQDSELLVQDPRADIDGILKHPTERTVQAARSSYDRSEWHVIDPEVAADLEYLATVADGDIEITSRTLDDRLWTVLFLMDNGPVRYYLYDREAKSAQFLFTNRKALEGLPLANMHPVIIQSRDGLNLVSYLSLPVWADPDGAGHPDQPLPTVLSIHGGPWARDSWGYHPVHQWLTNRGYAVLSVNYRGSTGFGKAFINASTLEWAGKMHDDLIDATNWLINEGIADPARTAIMGGSYGGYATLVGLTFTPDVFACGVDIVGPSNLATLLNSVPPYWVPMIEMMKRRVGDHTTDEGRAFLESRSPLTHVDRISKPLLIGQGANDPRVKQAESDQIVSAMQEKGIPVTYALFPDEGHGFARPENSLAFFAVAESFLAGHLGGRAEAIGEDFMGSTIQVPTGAEDVPGLPGARGHVRPPGAAPFCLRAQTGFGSIAAKWYPSRAANPNGIAGSHERSSRSRHCSRPADGERPEGL